MCLSFIQVDDLSPLHVASMAARMDVVRALLDAGGDVRQTDVRVVVVAVGGGCVWLGCQHCQVNVFGFSSSATTPVQI
jgi:hypothetical protein